MSKFLLIFLLFISCTAQKTNITFPENADLPTKLSYLQDNFKGKKISELLSEITNYKLQVKNIGMGSESLDNNKISYIELTFLDKNKIRKHNHIDALKINLKNPVFLNYKQMIINGNGNIFSKISNELALSKIKSLEYQLQVYEYKENGEIKSMKFIKPNR